MKTHLRSFSNFFACTVIAAFTFTGAYSQTTATSSGQWDDPNIWSSDSVPQGNEETFIPGGFIVDKTDSGTSAARIRVGSNAAGGTLNISNGRINSANTTIAAHRIATASNATATINVNGGELTTSSSNGGGIQVGVGGDSNGFLNITSGSITTTSGIHLGFGANSTGTMTVSGGTVITSAGTGTGMNNNNNPNFFVGALISSVDPRTGVFEQTGGSVTVTDGFDGTNYYFSVGNAQSETNNPFGTATITGGSLTANVKVGRNSDLTTAGGSGLLTIGPGATVQGQSQAWEVSGNGTLEFRLGANDSFNAVDLTTVTTAEAIMFTQEGATLRIDGSELPFSLDYDPIHLIAYESGKGPSAGSLDNITYAFVGFAPGLSASLDWTDTALVLNVIPEPATTALLVGVLALCGVAISRRRRTTGKIAD